MKYLKKISVVLSVIVVIFGIFVTLNKVDVMKVKADSGFDSSYDSGSSWDSGSSYDSGSSWGDSSDWGSSSGSYSGSHGGSLSSLLTFIVIIVVVIIIIRNSKNPNYIGNNNNISNSFTDVTREISEDEIRKIIPNFNKQEFLKERYNDYIEIQNAWMNFDYDKLRGMLTDELYNQYEMQLDTLKAKNQKNIMSDFLYKNSKITNISNENDKISITIELSVNFYDYIEQDGKCVRGNKNVKIAQFYEMTFVCSKVNSMEKCPNCGAKLDGNASNKCEYCGSVITGLSDKWVLSKKKSKSQMMVHNEK